jgi:hypothetical protein
MFYSFGDNIKLNIVLYLKGCARIHPALVLQPLRPIVLKLNLKIVYEYVYWITLT